MKTFAWLLTTTLVASAPLLAAAGIVITPIQSDQVVDKTSGDCFFGVVTPQGCGPKGKNFNNPPPADGQGSSS